MGKSTVALRYVDDHPLALLIEIDALRVAMGGWADHEESKIQARALALALARTHLAAGHDVVLPQYLGHTEFIDELEAVVSKVEAEFKHVVFADDRQAVALRFRSRRAGLLSAGGRHPQTDLTDDEIDAVIADAERRLVDLAADRRDVSVIQVSAGDPYDAMLAALGVARREHRSDAP